MTLDQVANSLGIKTNSLSDKELGKRPVDTEELAKLAKIYECEPWMLLATPPESGKLDQLKRATKLLDEMTTKEAKTWLDVGDTLTSREK